MSVQGVVQDALGGKNGEKDAQMQECSGPLGCVGRKLPVPKEGRPNTSMLPPRTQSGDRRGWLPGEPDYRNEGEHVWWLRQEESEFKTNLATKKIRWYV